MKVIQYYFLGCILTLLATKSFAQQVPAQNQFYVNPYIYNPAYVGGGNETILHTAFKSQWLGVEGAPFIGSATYQQSVNEKLKLGGFINAISEGPYNSYNLFATVGYSLKISEQYDQSIHFGLSVGLLFSTVNLNKFDDPSDPAVANTTSTFLPDGAVGISYSIANFKVGFALPRFAESSIFGGEGGDDIAPLNQMIYSLSYNYVLAKSNLALEPYLLYHVNNNLGNQLEGNVRIIYNNNIWLSAGYRQQYGTNLGLGAQLMDRYGLGYFYTLTAGRSRLPADSHELILSIVF